MADRRNYFSAEELNTLFGEGNYKSMPDGLVLPKSETAKGLAYSINQE